MDTSVLIDMVGLYGYLALFFCLWLGIVGIPIPDEVIVMSGGLIASLGILESVPAFVVTYLGVISGLTVGYGLGRIIGAPVLEKLAKKQRTQKHIVKAHQLINKYGGATLCISYLFPVVRHLVPYLAGISKMSYPRYALFSYTTGFVWTFTFFMVGRFFGMYIEEIGQAVHHYGLNALGAVVLLSSIIIIFRYLVLEKKPVV